MTTEAELDYMKRRLKEMEDEAAALREMQANVEKEMSSGQGLYTDPAHSKLRVWSWVLGEGLGLLITRVEGKALGWLHRAATTSLSQQWKDYRLEPINLSWVQLT
ncbi:hypothetical protein SAY86_027714 [Trapa natans]|uniref:Uncharacterized protein n=1 Tax=Trapa natans TaxID=22666 RepID=A0AAN7QJI3_TRANT|nr:hypothetical protein SAY86_027714 [Trapa natans]